MAGVRGVNQNTRKKRLAAEQIADELNACILGLGEVDGNALLRALFALLTAFPKALALWNGDFVGDGLDGCAALCFFRLRHLATLSLFRRHLSVQSFF